MSRIDASVSVRTATGGTRHAMGVCSSTAPSTSPCSTDCRRLRGSSELLAKKLQPPFPALPHWLGHSNISWLQSTRPPSSEFVAAHQGGDKIGIEDMRHRGGGLLQLRRRRTTCSSIERVRQDLGIELSDV